MADPVSMLVGAGVGAVSSLFGGHKAQQPQQQAMAPNPPPIQQPIGSADTNKTKQGQASFVAAAAPAAGAANQGGKTLLGQ